MTILKRTISALLALVMVVTMLPLSALAEETDPTITETTAETEPVDVGDGVLDVPEAIEPDVAETVPETTAPEVFVEETVEVVAADAPASGTCGENLTWTLVDGVLTISGEGEMHNFVCGKSPWYALRGIITSASVGNDITSIGDYAFWECANLTGIVLPDSVTFIGDGAFGGCTSLSDVRIPNSVTIINHGVFLSCSSLANATIPEGVTVIAEEAFRYCTNLTEIDIPNSLTQIGWSAFGECSSLTSIIIPDSVTFVGDGAFYNCTNLTSVYISNGITSIEKHTFYGCTSLTNVCIPDEVTSIGPGAFSGCTSLTSIYIPDGVISIGAWAFSSCTNLISVYIPDGITSIEKYAFFDCSQLSSILIPAGVSSISEGVFRNCSNLKNIVLSDGVTTIYNWAFLDCNSLTSVILPESIMQIHSDAFTGCSNLADIYYNGTETQWDKVLILTSWGSINAGDWYLTKNMHFNNTGAEGDDTEETPASTEPSSPESNYHLVLSPSEKTLTAKVGETLTIRCYLYNGDEKVTDWKLSSFNCPFVFGITFLETGDGCEYRLTGTEPGTFKVSFYEATHDVKAEVTVIVIEDSSAEDMWYETQEVQKQAYNHVKKYIRDWYDAYEGYVKAVNETLQAYTEKTEKTREELIATEAKRMRKHDDNKANRSKYISVGIDDKYLDYAYLALAAYFYDGTRTQMPDFSSLDVTNEKNIATQIAKMIVKNISSETRSYQFESVTVMVGGCSYFGVGFGDIVIKRNNERVGMTAFSSTLNECQASVMAYMEELRDMGTGAVWNVAAAVYNDILGVNLLNLTDSWLNTVVMKIEKNLAVKLTEKFHIAGVGNLLGTIRDSYAFYSLSLKITEISTTDDVQKILNNLLGYKFEDDTIGKWAVKSAIKELKKAANKLNRALNEYIEGTIVEKEQGFWRWLFGCPVSICVYNSAGEQIGYVGEDDIWYTDDISITELGGVKEIVSFTEDALSFTVTATDHGTMSCMFERYDENFYPVGRLNYYNVILAPEQTFQVSVPETLAEKTETAVITSGGEAIYPDEYISSEDSAGVTISCSAVTEDGITGGTVSGTGTYIRGDCVILRAEAYEGFRFVGWMDGEYLVGTEEIYEFPAREDCQLAARFYKEKPIAIQLEADIGGTAIGESRYDSGETVTIIAIPASGYSFAGWYAGEILLSADAEYSFPASESLILRAAFAQSEHPYDLGDVNHDTKINAKDATLILQKSVGVLKETAKFCEDCAEVSGDGKLNAKDSTLILQFSVGLRQDFPAQK